LQSLVRPEEPKALALKKKVEDKASSTLTKST